MPAKTPEQFYGLPRRASDQTQLKRDAFIGALFLIALTAADLWL